MSNVFLISDTHFSHSNILTFLNSDGARIRNFDSVDEMNETMVTNWNRVVRPNDKVYHLGDVCFKNIHLEILDRLNGTKVLIKGNHDNLKLSQYAKYFKDVRSGHTLDKYILTHIPIHPASLSRWVGNIHGHLHHNVVGDPRYINVSVEQINYTPISFENLKQLHKNQTPQ